MIIRRCISLWTILVWSALILVPSGAGAGFRRVNSANPADPMGVRIFELDNGLRVYLTENHETPRFYAEIAVRAGSKNDPPESTGLAHYLEHVLFKGTQSIGTLDYERERPHLDRISELYEEHFRERDPERRKEIYARINRESQLAAKYAIPNELDKVYSAMGGKGLNASTWQEETVFQVSLPSNRLRQWAVLESERFSRPVFRLFQPELEIVYEEKNRAQDDKDRIIREAVGTVLYKNHPYGQQTTLGKVDHLKNPSLRNLYRFYKTYYVPNNMAILMSGDIDIEETIRIIDQYFSKWRRRNLPKPPSWGENPLRGPERVMVSYEGEEYVLVAFRTAPEGHPDADALKLVDMILDNAVAGLINMNLNQQQKVRRAGAYPDLLNDYGAEYLWGVPKKGQSLEEVERLLLDQIETVKAEGFEDWLLKAIVTDFKKDRKSRMESDPGRVGLMRSAFLGYEEWDHAVAGISRMERLTREDIVRAARRYFGNDYVAGYRVDGQHQVSKIEKPQIDKVEVDPGRESEFADRVLAMPYRETEPVFVDPGRDFQKVFYHDPVQLYYARNPINDLFSFEVSVDLGNDQDNRMGTAARLLDKSGTPGHSPESVKKEWYKLGTDFTFDVRDNETSISLSGLDENFGPSLGLLMDLLEHPVADSTTLDELVKIIMVQREDAKKDPQAIRSALVSFSRYGKDSRYLRMLSDPEVQKLTADELLGVVRGLFDFKHSISYTGSLPLERVVDLLGEHHPISGELKDPPPFLFLKTGAPEKTQIRYFNKEMAQTHVWVEFGNEDYSETIIPAVELYNAYFGGGMTGVVFQEIREARALAYSTGAAYTPGKRRNDQNIMWAALGCQADKTGEAVEALCDLLDNLPVSADRFRDAQKSVLNGYRTSRLGFRQVLGSARAWERLGVPVDPRRPRFEAIGKADIGTMLEFDRAHVKGRPKLISVVGDTSRMDMVRLGRLGEVIEVGLKDIFVF